MKQNMLITGVTGFLAKQIALYAKEKGFRVLGTVSETSKILEGLKVADEVYVFNLLENELPSIRTRIDVLIHCVIDVEKPQASIQRTIAFNENLNKQGNVKTVFISSISMNEENKSNYSKIKQSLEEYILKDKNSLILRPGLVLGNGGLYLKMENYIKSGKIIPLPDGGKYKMAVVSIEHFVKYLFDSISNESVGIKIVYERELVSLATIVKNIAGKYKKRIYILYIPISLVELLSPIVIKILNIFKIKISFDSIIGYKLYRNLKLPESDLGL